MNTTSRLAVAVTLALTGSFSHANDWTGFYVGGVYGDVNEVGDDGGTIGFDTNLDGNFNDTINTAAGANAFTPGFCSGIAVDRTPASGCLANDGDDEWALRAGHDWQSGNLVYGALIEYGEADAVDAVSAFSITPARYTMIREVDELIAIRGRIGFTVADERGLIYATGGFGRAGITDSFSTSNTVNTFVPSGDDSANLVQFGLGYEHRFGANFSIGVEYMMSQLDSMDATVRVQGPAPATNPFILVNPSGTDFRASDDDLDLNTVRLTLGYRF